MQTIRVLVVDDSFFMRKVISDILTADPTIEVIGQASDGLKALEMIPQLKPDVVTLDIEMPQLNGLETLKQIMAMESPPPTIIVSGYAQKGSDLTFKCLSAGAIDIVQKPGGSISFEMTGVEDELRHKVKMAAEVDTRKLKHLVKAKSGDTSPHHLSHSAGGILVIGSSTGGPAALDTILPQIPEDFPYPIIIGQHLPGNFVAHFIERLGSLSRLPVTEAVDKLEVAAGTIYVAKGGTLTTVAHDGQRSFLSVSPDSNNFESPSVSELLSSAAHIYKDRTIAVVLTGMGHDGLSGAQVVKRHNGRIYVQDEATSVVYGMGREIQEAGLADSVLPLQEIIPNIISVLSHE